MATRKPAASTTVKKPKAAPAATQTGSYKHVEPKALIRPEIGVQNYAASQGKFRRGPTKYRYDDSLAPELTWDSQNPARERGEALIARIAELTASLQKLPLPQAPGTEGGSEHRGWGEGGSQRFHELVSELTTATKELKPSPNPSSTGPASPSVCHLTCRRCRCSFTNGCRLRPFWRRSRATVPARRPTV